MEAKLLTNVGKRDPYDPIYCADRSGEETLELREAIETRRSVEAVWREAADVCNLALMAAATYERLDAEHRGRLTAVDEAALTN